MDIAALSMVMIQSRVKQSASIVLMKKVMEIGEQNATQMTEMMKNNIVADPNLGQHFDAMA